MIHIYTQVYTYILRYIHKYIRHSAALLPHCQVEQLSNVNTFPSNTDMTKMLRRFSQKCIALKVI